MIRYLNDTANGSLDLFERLQESRGVITNAFDLNFGIGGSGNTPRCNIEVEKAHLESKKYQYQYMDKDDLIVMDMETFEQFNFDKDLLGDTLPFLQEEMEVVVEYCNDNPIYVNLPETVALEIAEAGINTFNKFFKTWARNHDWKSITSGIIK